jgi:hypothetical protein
MIAANGSFGYTAEGTIAIGKAHRARRLALVLPREHGAWGLLLIPMVTGAGIALRESHHFVPGLLLLASALALFWLRTPVESLIGTSAMRAHTRDERRLVIQLIIALAAAAGLCLGTLLWAGRNPLLWLIGAVAVCAFVAQALVRKIGRPARMLSEIIGTVGLTLSAPAIYYVITGKFTSTAVMLWLANLLVAGDQIHYVQLRIRTARIEDFKSRFVRGWTFAAGQFAMAGALVAAAVMGYFPGVVLLAFIPILFRGFSFFFQKPGTLVVRRLGWNELTEGIAFCVLFVGLFALA